MKSKNNNTKKIIIASAAFFLVGHLLFSSSLAFAQTPETTTQSPKQTNFFEGLTNFISQKFGLDKAQVQTALEDYKKQNKPNFANRVPLSEDQIKAKEKEKLDKLVTDGKITAEQKNLIIQESATLRAKYKLSDMKNLSADERKKQMDAMQQEIKSWATSNNIDAKYLMFGGMKHGNMHEPRGEWNKSNITPTP